MIIKWKLRLWLNKRRLVKHRKNTSIKKSQKTAIKKKNKKDKERVKDRSNKVSTCSQASRE